MANQTQEEKNEIDKIYDNDNAERASSKIKSGAGKLTDAITTKIKKNAGKQISRLALRNPYVLAALAAVIIVILVIVILIGIAAFIMLGPDSVRSKVVKMADDMWTEIKGLFIGAAEAQVKDEQVVEIAAYLDNMGYKLEGYGFGKAERDDRGKVTSVDSKYLTAYLAAENKTYMISNNNFSFKEMFTNITSLNPEDGEWGSRNDCFK